jgi:hypothetical protein
MRTVYICNRTDTLLKQFSIGLIFPNNEVPQKGDIKIL